MKLIISLLFGLLLIAALSLACGTSKPITTNCGPLTGSNTTGTLTAVTVCPVAADAKDYPDGAVPFLALGQYTTPPSPVPLNALWGACYQSGATTEVTVSTGGVAQCTAGATGVYDVFAAEPGLCNLVTACGGGCQISGSAKLTCP